MIVKVVQTEEFSNVYGLTKYERNQSINVKTQAHLKVLYEITHVEFFSLNMIGQSSCGQAQQNTTLHLSQLRTLSNKY